MRKLKAGLFTVILFVGINLSAENPISFGIKGGANLSNLSGEWIKDSKTKLGFNLGLTVDVPISSLPLYIATGVEYTTKGCVGKEVLGTKPSVNLGYIQVPVHIGYKISLTDLTSIKLHAGPYAAYGVNGKAKSSLAGVEISVDAFDDEMFKKMDFGAGIGASIGFGSLEVGLGWDFGFTNIVDVDRDAVKPQNAYLTLGYKF